MNNGYWSFPQGMSWDEIKRMHKVLNEHLIEAKNVLLVKDGIEFHPFGAGQTPDAICLYCCSANLHTSMSCEKCGAPLVHSHE